MDMARWAPEKKHVLGEIADEILHNYAQGRAMVAVDGRHGAGQREFASELADSLRLAKHRVFVASMDDFFRPRFDRDRIGSGADYFARAYDNSLVRRVLVDPYRMGGSAGFQLEGFDVERDQPAYDAKWETAPADAILIVAGVFLQRKELAALWNYTIWLATHLVEPSTGLEEYQVAADELYLSKVSPSERASTIVNNVDREHPRREFADSC